VEAAVDEVEEGVMKRMAKMERHCSMSAIATLPSAMPLE
jgi:hypothetical protein